MHFIVNPSRIHDATLTVPGDKSISHRALMLGSIANGDSHIRGFLAGEDCLATLAAMRAMGVDIRRPSDTEAVVSGVGMRGLKAPQGTLDLGNSGTGMRLMSGLLCAQTFSSTLVGDHSLSSRPMRRIITPLTLMGAAIESECDDTPPLQISGGLRLHGIKYVLPVASAQVKSALLLAGLYASGETTVIEPAMTRDHTERMLRSMGCEVRSEGARISLQGGQALTGCEIDIPADLSSAAFVMLAAILSEDARITISNVGVNPTRTGIIDAFKAMGANIKLTNKRQFGDEPVADIVVVSSKLQGTAIDPALVSLAIDEFPVLFVAAAAASGQTTFDGIGELRVKESDRIAAMAEGLRILGIRVDETHDGAVVHGGRMGGGAIPSHGDHRIAMAFAIAGSVSQESITALDIDNVETSFPDFANLMRDIGLTVAVGGEKVKDGADDAE